MRGDTEAALTVEADDTYVRIHKRSDEGEGEGESKGEDAKKE